jgi:hypothetical protein
MVQAFPDEIAAAGTDAQTLLAGKDVELIEAQSIGHQVFEAWARLLG